MKLAFFYLALSAMQPACACPCDTKCTQAHGTARAVKCLQECGLAVLTDVYNKDFLDEVNAAFNRWSDIRRNIQERTELRGKHFQVVLPKVQPLNSTKIIYNRRISQLVEKLYKSGGGNASLEFASFITNPNSSQYQGWHFDDMDNPFAVKVYIPLVDITEEMGPVEIGIPTHDIASTIEMSHQYSSSSDSK